MTNHLISAAMIGGSLLAVSACATGEQIDRQAAYAACAGTARGDALNACISNEMTLRSDTRRTYADAYQKELEACEARTASAGAMGVDASQIRCDAHPADYVLDGGPD